MLKLRGSAQAGAVNAFLLPPALLELRLIPGSISRDFVNVLDAAKRLQVGERVAFALHGEIVFDNIQDDSKERKLLRNIVFEMSCSTFDCEPFVYWGGKEDDAKYTARLQNAGVLNTEGYPTNALMHESILDGSALTLLVPDEAERRLVFDGLLSSILASVSIDVIDGETIVFSGSRYDFWKLANDVDYCLVQAQQTRIGKVFYYCYDAGPEERGQFSFIQRPSSTKSDNCFPVGEFYLSAQEMSTVGNRSIADET